MCKPRDCGNLWDFLLPFWTWRPPDLLYRSFQKLRERNCPIMKPSYWMPAPEMLSWHFPWSFIYLLIYSIYTFPFSPSRTQSSLHFPLSSILDAWPFRCIFIVVGYSLVFLLLIVLLFMVDLILVLSLISKLKGGMGKRDLNQEITFQFGNLWWETNWWKRI